MKITINGQMLSQCNMFALVFNNANLASSFRDSKYLPNYQKMESVMCIFSNLSTYKFYLKR